MKKEKQKLKKAILIIIFLLIFIPGLMLTFPKGRSLMQSLKNGIWAQNNQQNISPNNVNINTSVVEIQTSKGNIQISLENNKMPKTVSRFLELADNKFYDGVYFDKVFDWTVQSSCNVNNQANINKIPLEANNTLINQKGAIGMIQDEENNMEGCGFYILKKDAPWLDTKCAVFGHVLFGMNVVNSIVENDKIVTIKRIR